MENSEHKRKLSMLEGISGILAITSGLILVISINYDYVNNGGDYNIPVGLLVGAAFGLGGTSIGSYFRNKNRKPF